MQFDAVVWRLDPVGPRIKPKTNEKPASPRRTALPRLVQPLQNQLVCFPSGCLHEILPVVCPSGAFEHSRFTINGWFHQ